MRIQLVPNSGHQFFWVPFEEAAQKGLTPESKTNLLRLCNEVSKRWTKIEAGGRQCSWARSKFGWRRNTRGEKEFGIELVLESNLGDVVRGSLLTPAEEVVERPFTGQTATAYAFRSENDISHSGQIRLVFDFEKSPETPDDRSLLAELDVYWPTSMAQAPIPVDLIVDFGNTRTVALLLEEIPAQVGSPSSALRQMVRPIKFVGRGTSYSDSALGDAIVESWFVLHEPQFAEFEVPALGREAGVDEYHYKTVPPKKNFWGKVQGTEQRVITHVSRRIPQMFVELSPVVLGEDAAVALRTFRIPGGGVSFLSSPKRYAWDNQPSEPKNGHIQLAWTMVRNDWNPDRQADQNATLAGQVLRFFPHDGLDWELANPPTDWDARSRPVAQPVQPVYPKADALAWMALSVIETAHRQMNAHEYWKEHFPYVRRVLRSIQVTYPSGWTGPELKAYKLKWKKALQVFAHGHLEDPSLAPTLDFPVDEAIASQLPIIFAEIQHMGSQGENWLALVGRSGDGGQAKLRALTIDIGGGTTDYSVVEYRDDMAGPGVELVAKLLFKDSTNVAGDWLVKALLERLLLPKLGERFRHDESATDAYEAFFRQSFSTQAQKETWKKLTRLVLIPQVVSWLSDLCAGREPRATCSSLVLDSGTVKELNDMFYGHFSSLGLADKLPKKTLIQIEGNEDDLTVIDATTQEICEVAKEVFLPTISSLSKFITAFDVDLVIVAGKPSELPLMQELLFSALPITQDRILFAKGYYAGDWYPFNRNGFILDAKTVTAVGLALYRAIRNNRIAGWAIRRETCDNTIQRNYWLRVPDAPGQKPQVYLDAKEDVATVEMMINTRIGRRLLPSSRHPEPTYIVRWKAASQPPSRISVTLRRTPPDDTEESEELHIESVHSLDSQHPADSDDVALELCTLDAEEYWLDNPRFRVLWED